MEEKWKQRISLLPPEIKDRVLYNLNWDKQLKEKGMFPQKVVTWHNGLSFEQFVKAMNILFYNETNE